MLGETDIAQPTAEQERRRGLLATARQRVTETENSLKRLILGDTADPEWSKEIVPTDEPEANYEPPPLADMLAVAQDKRPEIMEAEGASRPSSEVQVDGAEVRRDARGWTSSPPTRGAASRARSIRTPRTSTAARSRRAAADPGRDRPLLRHDRREPLPGRVDRPVLLRADHEPHRAGEPRDRELAAPAGEGRHHGDATAGRGRGAQRLGGPADGAHADRVVEGGAGGRGDAALRRAGEASTSGCRRTSSS